MRKNIKNYTSGWTINVSMSKIQELLVSKGAEKIMIDYKDGEPTGLTFAISTPKGLMPVSLPARVEKVEAVFYKNKKPRYDWQKADPLTTAEIDQAKRTAWRNIHDWIDAQLALIETEMVKMEEVFLPYVMKGNQTIFEHFENDQLLLE